MLCFCDSSPLFNFIPFSGLLCTIVLSYFPLCGMIQRIVRDDKFDAVVRTTCPSFIETVTLRAWLVYALLFWVSPLGMLLYRLTPAAALIAGLWLYHPDYLGGLWLFSQLDELAGKHPLTKDAFAFLEKYSVKAGELEVTKKDRTSDDVPASQKSSMMSTQEEEEDATRLRTSAAPADDTKFDREQDEDEETADDVVDVDSVQ